MPKTNFNRGQRVPREWFNAMQNILFRNNPPDADGYYPALDNLALSDIPGNVKPDFYAQRDAGLVTNISALTVRVAPFSIALQNGTRVNVAQTQLTLSDNATRIVFVDSTGALQSAGSAPDTGVLLARVQTSGGAVSLITDLRDRVNFQVRPIAIAASPTFVMPSGSMIEFAGSTAPNGWLLCDGSEVLRSQYPDLFAAIGTTWGTPSNGTVFKLPDHRDRSGRGASGTTALGSAGGNDAIALTTAQMPAHTHTLNDPGHSHSVTDPGHVHNIFDPGHNHVVSPRLGGTDANGGTTAADTDFPGDKNVPYTSTTNTTGIQILGAGSGVSVNGSGTGITMQQSGSGQSIDIRNRFLGVNYLIKT